MNTIQQELRKTAHYLSMRKRDQAAARIDKLEAAPNQMSEDEMLLTHQSTIVAQQERIAELEKLLADRTSQAGDAPVSAILYDYFAGITHNPA